MLYSTIFAGAVFALTASVNARPNPQADKLFSLFKRTLTTDNTCGLVGGGNNNGYTCDPTLAQGGPCCSQNGYCGSSVAYCGAGCQPAYGNCTSPTASPTSSTPTSTPTGIIISTNEQCGKANGNTTCPMGQCCSINGYCAADTAHCQACQPAYSQNSTCVAAGSGDVCGPSNGNAVCSGNECCSSAGYCGVTEDYCADPQCQPLFGTCDSDMTPAGPSTINDSRPQLGSVTYTDDIDDCIQNNVVAFTFDDGPYNYTSHVLDILKSYGAQATFFITGNNLGKGPIDTTSPYPALIQRMYNEGHQIASHTWSHYDLSNITHDMRMQQMVKNERALANILGFYPTYMRPPYSDCTAESGCEADMQALGYHRTYFDLDTQDYLNDASNLIQNSKNIVDDALFGSENAGNTDYLSIMHDIHYQTAYNLTEFFLQELKKKGWKAVAVGTCLNDPVANWYRYPSNGTSTSSSASLPTSSSTSTLSSTSFTLTTSSVVSSTSIIVPSTTSLGSTTSTLPSSTSIPLATQSSSVRTSSVSTTSAISRPPVPATTSSSLTTKITSTSTTTSKTSTQSLTPTPTPSKSPMNPWFPFNFPTISIPIVTSVPGLSGLLGSLHL